MASNLENAIVANGNNALNISEAISAIVPSDKGNSGTGTGVVLTGTDWIDCSAELGFIPRLVYCSVAGNVVFKTLDGKAHIIPMAEKTMFGPVFMPYIAESSNATPTTATIHLF